MRTGAISILGTPPIFATRLCPPPSYKWVYKPTGWVGWFSSRWLVEVSEGSTHPASGELPGDGFQSKFVSWESKKEDYEDNGIFMNPWRKLMNFHGIFHELSMGFFIFEDFWRRFFFFDFFNRTKPIEFQSEPVFWYLKILRPPVFWYLKILPVGNGLPKISMVKVSPAWFRHCPMSPPCKCFCDCWAITHFDD